MPEELKPCEHDWGIYQALHDFNAPDNSFCEYVCFKCQEKKMVKPRPAEKLVPLDILKYCICETISECAHKACDAAHHLVFNKMTIQKKGEYLSKVIRTHNESFIEDICARFASVPVVPDMVWPDTIKPSLSGDGSYVNGYMDAIEACKAAHAKALAVDKSYMGDGKTTSQEAKERKG